jgi:hypothetical protein
MGKNIQISRRTGNENRMKGMPATALLSQNKKGAPAMVASRSFASLLWLAVAAIGAAQEGKNTTIPGWGEFIDPAGDCQATVKAEKLSITVPGTEHNLNPLPGWNNLLAPRVVREVEGDFRIQVKLLPCEMPKPDTSSNKEKPASYAASGIVLWQDGNHFSRVFRAANGERNEFFIHIENFSGGKIVSSGSLKLQDKAVHLRVERQNGKLSFYRSLDGKNYLVMRPNGEALVLADKIKVGVALVNSTTKAVTHHFEELQVTQK